jgi:hypothetical protein
MNALALRVVARFLARQAASLPRKGKKYHGSFHGDDAGSWELGGYLRGGWAWDAALSLARENDWRNLMVDGATEHHAGFHKALREMVREYPELHEFVIKFDGPWIPVSQLLGEPHTPSVNWEHLTFYHGTSSTAASRILVEGLRPRSHTNVVPAYGVGSGAGVGRAEAVYLTTQLSMAKFAALDAAKAHHGTAVVLEVRGIDGSKVAADEDSRETDPTKSLARIGSIAYLGDIPASKVQVALTIELGAWVAPKTSALDRQADLDPPLGYPGGPCHVVERIEKEVRNPAVRDDLVEDVEHGEKVQNPDAAKIYSPDREHGIGSIDNILITPHAQYRMDLRGITVPLVRAGIRSLLKALNDWKSQKNQMYQRVTEGWARGTSFEWVDSASGLSIVVRPKGHSMLLVTTYWKGEADPRPPGACP